jgi:ADP-ribose pyrophosphatase YjhB (NUDIX family)
VGRIACLAQIVPNYAAIAWWGIVSPRTVETRPLLVMQGVVIDAGRVLLSVRGDLHGWELPGGNPNPGESDVDALKRELREETGLEVAVERRVGDYIRTGFRPHTARVFACRPVGGELRPSTETPRVAWFPFDRIPDTFFPWYRAPLADALEDLPEPVTRHEHQGVAAIWAGLSIDFRMRVHDDSAGLR